MVIKKRGFTPEQQSENPNSQDTQQQIKRPKLSILSKCLHTRCLFKEGWLEDPFVQGKLEDVLRKMVREVTESIVSNHLQTNPRNNELILGLRYNLDVHENAFEFNLPIERFDSELHFRFWSSGNVAELSKSRKYKLHFDGQVPRVFYTENRIEAVGSLPFTLKLLDALTGNVVTDSPLSFAKVKIVTLHGDFKVEMLEDWTHKEFDKHIVLPRPKPSALLVGGCVTLCDGICSFKGFRFYDNSSWVKSKMFRLGARIVAKEDQVREAVSCPFKVMHRRGEPYQKRNTPTMNDEVWRLAEIARDGKIHERLKKHQIYKVGDLLQQYHTNQTSLCDIIGSSKAWKAIVQQIKTFFGNNECTYESDCPPSFLASVAILPSSNPFSAAVATQVQPEVQMPKTHGMEASHALEHEIDSWVTEPQNNVENWSLQSVVGGRLSWVGNLGVSTSNTAKPKRRFWSKIRAVWKFLLVKYGVATLKKGKSTCISYYYC